MVYCVVPKSLADELYPTLVKHYEGDENVTVIVDRREFDRRARRALDGSAMTTDEQAQRRTVRDRRRARVVGDALPLAHA
jgi:ERCC4-type nuclease